MLQETSRLKEWNARIMITNIIITIKRAWITTCILHQKKIVQ